MRSRTLALFSLLLTVGAFSAEAATLKVVNFGAMCNGTHNDTANIQAAFNAAATGDLIEFPSGTCLYSNTLGLNTKSMLEIYGAGKNSTKLKGANPLLSAIRVINGFDIEFRDLQVTVPTASTRSGDPNTAGFYVAGGDTINFFRVKVDRVASAGIVADGVTHFGVYDSEIRNTLADGVHITGGSYSATISRNTAVNTGDDSFACVGYGTVINHYVGFYDNTSTDSQASGSTAEGCEFVEIHRNIFTRSRVSGIRVNSNAFWSTGRVNEVDVRWNTIDTAPIGDKVNHSGIIVFSDNQVVERVHVRDNTILNPQAWSAVRLYGSSGGIVRNSEIERNAVWGGTGITDCISLEGNYSNILVQNNSYNLGGCF